MNKKSTISDLVFDDKNFNKGSEFGTSLMDKSLSKFGAGRSVLIDKNNRLIAGNKTTEKFGELGGQNVLIVDTDKDTLVAVRRSDIDLDTPEGREFALADNATAKANIVWDAEVLEAEISEAVCEEWGVKLDKEIPEATEDDFNGVAPKEPITVLGDLYEIGRHRLLCGSSTEADAVNRLLNGKEPYLMVTDPPYGVVYDANWRNEAERADGTKIGASAIGKVKNDNNADWTEAWALSPSKVCYVWHAGKYAGIVQKSLEDCDFEIRSQIIWNKSNFAIGRGDYHWKHEPCWYAVKKGNKGNWASDRKQTTVWDIAKPQKSETGHSTQKPIECMARPITHHDGDVYEPFAGSGTTIVSSEQLHRKCYAMELDPKYCDVIVARMIKLDSTLEIKRNGIILTEGEKEKYLTNTAA